MKRSGFKRPVYERKPSTPIAMKERRGVVAPVADVVVASPKGEKAKHGKYAPTKEEAEWMRRISALGCVACLADSRREVPAAVHHILRGGRRMGHLFTIPLCDPGHHQNGSQMGLVSRHPYKARFEAKYGTELELLEKVRALVWTKRVMYED